MKRVLLPTLCSLLFSSAVQANDLNNLAALAQGGFRDLSIDLTGALSY